jgi:hypothetical protein
MLQPMGTRMWVLGLVLTAALACGLDSKRAGQQDDEKPRFSADSLELSNHDSVLELLDPEEREAITRSQMSGFDHLGAAPADGGEKTTEQKADDAAKVGLSVLSVAVTVGMAVAPFFLF